MTPKLGQALEALKKLKSFAEDEGEKLTKRIHEEAEPLLIEAFKGGHDAIDVLKTGVTEITDFCTDLKKVTSNGPPPGPLPGSSGQSGQPAPQPQATDAGVVNEQPRSSDVATR